MAIRPEARLPITFFQKENGKFPLQIHSTPAVRANERLDQHLQSPMSYSGRPAITAATNERDSYSPQHH